MMMPCLLQSLVRRWDVYLPPRSQWSVPIWVSKCWVANLLNISNSLRMSDLLQIALTVV